SPLIFVFGETSSKVAMLERSVKHRSREPRLKAPSRSAIFMIDENECSNLAAMAGVKQFDRDEVLDRAMAAFWTRGYEATSIDDLVQATGIGRGSLYGTFGDKRQLFLAALDHYWNTVGMEMF